MIRFICNNCGKETYKSDKFISMGNNIHYCSEHCKNYDIKFECYKNKSSAPKDLIGLDELFIRLNELYNLSLIEDFTECDAIKNGKIVKSPRKILLVLNEK